MKSWRIWRIVGNKKLKIVVVTQAEIIRSTIILLVFEIAFLSIWTIFDRPKSAITESNGTQYQQCTTKHNFWWGIFVGYKLLLLVAAIYVSIRSRKFQSVFNESKQTGLSVWVMALSIVILLTLGYLLDDFPQAIFILSSFGLVIPYAIIIGLLFSDSLFRIFIQHKPPKKWIANSLRTSGHGSAKDSVSTARNSKKANTTTDGESPTSPQPAAKKISSAAVIDLGMSTISSSSERESREPENGFEESLNDESISSSGTL